MRSDGPTRVGSAAIAAMFVVMLAVGGCSSHPSALATSPPVRPTSTPTGTVVKTPTAWSAVLDQIGPDGTVTTATALQAFAVAFGPLPGVTIPPGPRGTVADGTAPLRWLASRWGDLTAAQRAAAITAVPELAPLGGGPASASPAARVVGPNRSVTALAPRRAVTSHHPDAFYAQLADQEAKAIAAKVGVTLTLPLRVTVGPSVAPPPTEPPDSVVLAYTTVVGSYGSFYGPVTRCDITVAPPGDALTASEDLALIMAHEVWHCYEGQLDGFATWNAKTSEIWWITEGEAQWLSESLHPAATVTSTNWDRYFDEPQRPLFQRTYDAVGFYAELAQSGVNVWSRLIPIFRAGDNNNDSAAAYAVAGGNAEKFLDMWAAGTALAPTRGLAWTLLGPGLFDSPPKAPTVPTVSADGTADMHVEAYANAVYAPSPNDVMTLVISGYGRASDTANHDYVIGGPIVFCHLSQGCACPNVTTAEPPLPPLLDVPLIAMTGGPTGNTGTMFGESLSQYCARQHDLTGRWTGTYTAITPKPGNGTFTLNWTQKGDTLSGIIVVGNSECVSTGTISGTVKGNVITFGAVQGSHTVTFTGVASRDTMSGTYAVIGCGNGHGVWSGARF